MKRTSLAILAVVIVVGGMIASGALFTVDQRVQAIVMQFGEPKRVIQQPGLYFKMPFIQNVVLYDKRVLNLDPPTEEITLSDKKRINVDAFVRYKIVDPLEFLKTVRTEANLRGRFSETLNSSLRAELGRRPLEDLLSDKRVEVMENVNTQVARVGKLFGIEVVDVLIGRTDLPEDISKNVYDRMRSEREREANLLRAEGDEAKQRVTADADRQKIIILAQARKEAQILMGEGDSGRINILGKAHGSAPDFFAFVRSLDAYKATMKSDDTTMVLTPKSEFFKYFDSSRLPK